jgi:hypothetical protein
MHFYGRRNPEGVASPSPESRTRRNSFRVATKKGAFVTQGFKANPGLKLANAFSVIFLSCRTLSAY